MSIKWPRVQIVDAPTLDATVLFDLATSAPGVVTYPQADGWALPTPELAGDPTVPGVAWEPGEMAFTQDIRGTKAAALAQQSALARVLLRRRFWVMFQLDMRTAPVWWHAYRTQPGSLSFDNVWVEESDGTESVRPDSWEVGIRLTADPFGYGERVTLPAVSVGGDPDISSPTAWRAALPAIAGDAPTGLRVTVARTDGAATTLGAGARVAVVSSRDDADPVRVLKLGDTGWTAGADTAQASGRRTTTFVDTNLTPRVTGAVSTVEPGAYTALLRVRAGASATAARTLTTVLQVTGAAGPRVTHSFKSGSTAQWLDLGRVVVGRSLPADLPNATQAGPLSLSMGTDLTGWAVEYDHLLLLPVDNDDATTTMLKVATTTLPAGNPTLVVDADTESAWLTGDNPSYSHGTTGALSGGVPVADPGAARNTLVFLAGARNVAGSATVEAQDPTAETATYSLTVSYQPRVLWLGDGEPNPLLLGTP